MQVHKPSKWNEEWVFADGGVDTGARILNPAKQNI